MTNKTKRKLLRSNIKEFIVVGLVFFQAIFAFGAEFEVNGRAVFDVYNGQNLQQSRTNHFTVSVRGPEWSIVTWPSDNTYRLECAMGSNYLRTLFDNVGYITKAARPSFNDQFLQTLWLTYCSAVYFQTITNGMIDPIWELDDPTLQDKGFKLQAKWNLNEMSPKTPLEVFYISDGIYHGYNFNQTQQVVIRLPSPYDVGYTCAVFRVNSTLKIKDGSVPSEFYFETRSTPLGGRQPTPRTVMLGEVDSIKTNCSVSSFEPLYHGTATIWDYCVAEKLPVGSVNVVSYLAHDGDWPQGKELDGIIYKYLRREKIRQTADRNLAALKGDAPTTQKQIYVRVAFISLMGGSLAVLIVFGLLRIKKRN